MVVARTRFRAISFVAVDANVTGRNAVVASMCKAPVGNDQRYGARRETRVAALAATTGSAKAQPPLSAGAVVAYRGARPTRAFADPGALAILVFAAALARHAGCAAHATPVDTRFCATDDAVAAVGISR